MPNRPWILIVLACLQILTPVADIFFNAWGLKVSPGVVLDWWFQRPPLEIFESFLLMPIAGIAIYQMKRWSYFVFFGALLWNIVSSLKYIDYALTTFPAVLMIVFSLLNLSLVTYFLLPAVRRTYFDPTVRWWETLPRFAIHAPVKVQAPGQPEAQGKIVNLSLGGAFLELPGSYEPGASLQLRFEVLCKGYAVDGEVVRATEGRAYGIRFIHTKGSEREFAKLVEGLRAMGFEECLKKKPLLRALVDGIAEFARTGRGLLPQVNARGKASRE